MASSLYLSTIGKAIRWAQANSLWFTSTGSGCCADELLSTLGCRYDLERFGCVSQPESSQCDLLIVSGMVSHKAAPYLKELYESMLQPRYVLALGSCASCGGPFAPEYSYAVVPGVDHIVPVDVYVPGCPPRPEAVMNGLITLQERIGGRGRANIQG